MEKFPNRLFDVETSSAFFKAKNIRKFGLNWFESHRLHTYKSNLSKKKKKTKQIEKIRNKKTLVTIPDAR